MTIGKNKLEEEACMNRFYKTVLSWDYAQLCDDSKKTKKDSHKAKASDLKEVKNTFTDVDDYLSTFEPLLFEEVKAQIVQNKEDDEDEGTSILKHLMCVVQECRNSDGFYFPVVIYDSDEGKSISQNDLLLFSQEGTSTGDEFRSAYAFAFALVEHRQGVSLRLRMFLDGEGMGCHSQRLASFRQLLSDSKSVLYISKVCSLSTIIREFVAMRSIGSLSFKDVILKATDTTDSTRSAWEVPQRLMESIESTLNESQLEAIHAGLSRKPFVLIQGPPGTGKTQTILGLLNAILHSVPARMNTKDQLHDMKRGPELPMEEKTRLWRLASPWLSNSNPRDEIMPVDGDDGFFPISGNELKPEVVNSRRKYRVRVLVCAPSNSALDEIVLRVLHTGVRDENDRAYNPKIVRIGLKAHHSVRAVSMDYLVEQKLAGLEGHQSSDKQKQGTIGDDRDSIRASILDEAVIVFSTLSFSGSPIFSRLNRNFDIVIIDEAAQAVEPATLVPLATGCKQVFLVGDPKQLPATVISPLATKLGYNQSLFQRFQRAGYPVFMLKTQYRMHPEIRSFPSEEFYENALEDGSDVKERTMRAWHMYQCFGPLCFFDIEDGAESQPVGSSSWVNVDEVEFVLLMYQKLVGKYPELKSSDKMAIISPYGQQVKLFKKRFREMFGVESEKIVDINSVDGCQGRERDVVIFSCVRASKDRGIGFVADYRRMNVGITRARSSVLIVGSASTLKKDKHWGNLVQRAEKRKGIFHVSKPYENFFTDKSLEEKVVENLGDEEDMEEDDTNFGDVPSMDVGMAEDAGDYGDGDMDMGGDED